MGIKPTSVTYEFSTEEIENMLAEQLGVKRDNIEVTFRIVNKTYNSYDRDSYPTLGSIQVKTKPV